MGCGRAVSMRTVIVFSRASLTTTPCRVLRPATLLCGVSATEEPPLVSHRQHPGDVATTQAQLAGALEGAGDVLEPEVEDRLARITQRRLQRLVVHVPDLLGLHAHPPRGASTPWAPRLF